MFRTSNFDKLLGKRIYTSFPFYYRDKSYVVFSASVVIFLFESLFSDLHLTFYIILITGTLQVMGW